MTEKDEQKTGLTEWIHILKKWYKESEENGK